MEDPIEYLIKQVLGYRKGEQIGLVYDNFYNTIIHKIADYCQYNSIPFREVLTDYKSNDSLSEEVKHSFLDSTPQIIIIGLKDNIWHTEERKEAKYGKKKKIANLLYSDGSCESYFATQNKLEFLGKQLAPIISESNNVHILSEAGTNLHAKIGKTFSESNYYNTPGNGGDFPIGEIGFSPLEGTVNGRLVYDFKIQHVGFVRNSHHIIDVKNDKISSVKTSKEFNELIHSHSVFEYISEISIGINPIWCEVENKSSIIEEKNLGTMHFGHGGNFSYGNRKGPHFDSVILEPTIYLDDWLLMKKGVFNKKYINIEY